MSYTAITSGEIATGEPISNSTLTKIKDDLADHESRISAVEGTGVAVYPPLTFTLHGLYEGMVRDDIMRTTTNFNITITGVRLLIKDAGTAGTTEIDIEFKRGGGSWTSIFTTLPSVAYSAGNDTISSNAVLDSDYVELETGDLIRLNITSAQELGHTFQVRIDYTKT